MLVTKIIGETTAELSNRLKIQHGYDKVAICGKLDPMARGEVRVLINQNTKLMSQYLSSIKTYEFKLVIGVKTDTDDIMGLVTNTGNNDTGNNDTGNHDTGNHDTGNHDTGNHDTSNISSHILDICSRKTQHFHPFSAIKLKIDGVRKSLHHWALAGKLNTSNLPSKQVSVDQVTIKDSYTVDLHSHYVDIVNRLNRISSHNRGTFRVDQILTSWDTTIQSLDRDNITHLEVIPIEMTVSSGFYIRMLAYYLYEDYGIVSNIFDINRIRT